LEQVELLPPAVISRLDESTFRVIGELERPTRQGKWDRRGMVVGHVQSGKTSHYTALACKAADAGYKLIVVLTGMHDSLRSQTQLRLDQGLLGFDTQFQSRTDEDKQARIGVGALPGAGAPKIGSLTSSRADGDFKKNSAQTNSVPIGDMPILLVMKKHGSIIDNLTEWVTTLHGVPVSPDSPDKVVPDVPLLIIDDEADNASINTKKAGGDPSTINGKIRTLLKRFDKSAYVSYTATPFANIYSDISETDSHGMDLFPRHFIENLKAPSNYFGPTRVFGLAATEDEAEKPPLPIFRRVDDYAAWLPDKHKAGFKITADLPPSLQRAVLDFFLVCAARRARGQEDKHNSMLVHVTRYQLVQDQVASQVTDFLANSRYRLRYGDGSAASIWDELEQLWANFEDTSAQWDTPIKPLSWDELRPHIVPAVDKIEMKTINGESQDALEYYDHRKTGLSVIAIGGDKLSRGLTLEGLSVSYYLRAAKMYDTLMQMGRWFGYRPGYEDLCRLYTTKQLRDWYREITAASEELRADFDDMAERRGTPEEYGLRVQYSSAGLSVTSPSKMRKATTVTMTFSGDLSESVTFRTDDATVAKNMELLTALIDKLKADTSLLYTPKETGKRGNYIWRGVPGSVVADFFDGYSADSKAVRAKPPLLSGYIRAGLATGELTDWTVALVSSSTPEHTKTAAGLDLGLTVRSPLDPIADVRADNRYTIRRILSPSDESLDLTEEQEGAALAALRLELATKAAKTGKTFKDPDYPRGPSLRRQRPATSALLLIYVLDDLTTEGERIASQPIVGFAASFPFSAKKLTAKYKVNEVWFQQMLAQMPDDEDDDD
jgi:hypothetical protein